MSVATTTTKGAGATAPALADLWRAREELRHAIDDGADYLQIVLDEIEDQLIETLAERRREEAER